MIIAKLSSVNIEAEITASGKDVAIIQVSGLVDPGITEILDDAELILEDAIADAYYIPDLYTFLATRLQEMGWDMIEIKKEPDEAPDDVVY